MDLDRIHTKILREYAEQLATPLTNLLNLSLRNGVVPESIIKNHLFEFLEIIFFAGEQQGFRAKRSCTTNLLETFEDWKCAVGRGYEENCVFLDSQKAFDTVQHQRLLTKLEAWGMRGDTINLIVAFSKIR